MTILCAHSPKENAAKRDEESNCDGREGGSRRIFRFLYQETHFEDGLCRLLTWKCASMGDDVRLSEWMCA